MQPRRRWLWAVVAMVAAFVPFARGLSLTRIFFARDLSLFFWPRHLWMRDVLRSGQFPLWDPYAAGGQPVFPDALNQLFLPPVLALRALLPAVLGFNLIVALPFPIAALGAWAFLRRRFADPSAAFGAVIFAVSGCVLSTGNFPNLSWSVAFMPWTLWALDRDLEARSLRSAGVLALTIALQILAGEPVSLVATLAVLGGYAVLFGSSDEWTSLSAAVTVAGRLIAVTALAVLIASVQFVPMALAARHSQRAMLPAQDFWSLHPLWVVESVLPHIFGDTFKSYLRDVPWIPPLNSKREPFFFSIYLGPLAVMLAWLGTFGGQRRWGAFWILVAIGGLVFGLGEYTPIYHGVQTIVPGLRSFRFPAKFFLLTSLGTAMLAASGAEALRAWTAAASAGDCGAGAASASERVSDTARMPRAIRVTLIAAMVCAAALAGSIALVLFAPFTAGRAIVWLGAAVQVPDPVAGAEYLFATVPIVGGRTLLLMLVGAVLVYVASRGGRASAAASALLLVAAAVDLVAASATLNPVLEASRFAAPSWVEPLRAHPEARFYFGGKFGGTMWGNDPDLAFARYAPPPGLNVIEGRSLISAYTAMTPAAWRVREMLSYDLPQLWPIEQSWAAKLFHDAKRPQRMRFLARTGVRYCLTAAPPVPGAAPMRIVEEPFAVVPVFDCQPSASRVYVADTAVAGDGQGGLRQLFSPYFGNRTVMIASSDARGLPAGSASKVDAQPLMRDVATLRVSADQSTGSTREQTAAQTGAAHIVVDEDRRVAVEASAPAGGGYLVLLDSYDDGWRATVDGVDAPVMRANILFRAVRLGAGPHRVEFVYQPRRLYVWLAVSLLATLAALIMVGIRPRAAGAIQPAAV